MDKANPLAIHRSPQLYRRFPTMTTSAFSRRRQGGWIVFGEVIDPRQLDDIRFFTGDDVEVVDGWRVGPYEVLLIRGELTDEHRTVIEALELDCADLQALPDLSRPGLAVFDMDSTAIEIECIDEIAALAEVGEAVSAVTERAMLGELDFEASLRQRVAALKGSDAAILETVKAQLPLMPEMADLVASLKACGWYVAIASGGFTHFSDHLQRQLGLDYAASNQLGVRNGQLTGEVEGNVVDAQRKADVLTMLAQKYDIAPENTLAVGDGANDLAMMEAAGLGIAYHAKPKVNAKAQAAVKHAWLGGVLCVLSASIRDRISWQPR
ncbi:phosphoserine phosphatase SerB [Salinivibrio sp. ML323]|uniref:phosphoserine phosphatase n=1 Tax=unclassified Salinivibrio TaxID=2636825 RepID=UPI000987B0AA|nr:MULTISPECIES: phosphoserine phosphatase [unclassified Salinivibrio]OOE57583.1 phosphoserine phosphatase SerB [Salinivibrio sp. ML323]